MIQMSDRFVLTDIYEPKIGVNMIRSFSSSGCSNNQENANKMNNMHQRADISSWLSDVAKERSKVAFANLFKWFAPKVISYGIAHLNSQANANELLQETMTNVWKKAHYFDESKGAATTWVYTIMRNVSFDMLRKMRSQKEELLSDDIWPIIEAQSVEEIEFSDHLMQAEIQRYLKALPAAQQQVVEGVYFQQLSQDELAKQLKIPVGTVKSRLRLALNKLKQQMGEGS